MNDGKQEAIEALEERCRAAAAIGDHKALANAEYAITAIEREAELREAAEKMSAAMAQAHAPHADSESAGWAINDAWVALNAVLSRTGDPS